MTKVNERVNCCMVGKIINMWEKVTKIIKIIAEKVLERIKDG